MKKSKRIQAIVDIKAEQASKALTAVAEQQNKIKAAQAQLLHLQQYRQDYIDKDARSGVKRVSAFLEFRAFIAKLDEALETQVIEKFDMQSLMRSKFFDVMLQALSSKGLVWSVEEEWRLVYYNEKSNLKIQRIDLPNDAITALYLGCLVTDHWKKRFLSELKLNFPNAVVFVARKAKGEFALEFEAL